MQSQQAGGGGGGGMGNEQGQISERQKQIIAATWNETRSSSGKGAVALKEDARFLSDTQGKLSEQAKTLAERMGNRELAGASKEFENFSKLMTDASGQMNNAVGELKPGKWRDALPHEQKALQSLLRAEALFRNIQVAFGQQGGGGGGGGGAQRDLARMFDLELDTTKNQYETGQQSEAEKASAQQKAIDDAFEKLKELARRQQELAQQGNQQQAFEQRWQQEQLRREAEEMRRQMEQLARNTQGQQQGQQQEGSQQQQQQGQQGQQGQQQSSRGSEGSSGGSAGQSQSRSGQRNGQEGGQQSREMRQALDRSMEALRRAEDEMRKAVSGHDATAERRAAEQLAEAQNLLNKALGTQAGNSASEMAQRAQEIASAQRDLARRMRQMYGAEGESEGRRPAGGENGGEMPAVNDPNARQFRRYWQGVQPRREPTQEEKQIAGEKEKLGQQLEQLQKQMQKQSESLAGTQPELGRKMRDALSDAEQKELALRMQKNGELLRQGYGDRNLEMEGSVTMALDDLARELRDIQQGLKAGGQGDRPGQANREAETLARLRSLRESLERSQQNGQGQQAGGQQPGQQNGSQQSGSQPGGPQQGGAQPGSSQQGGSQQGGAYSPRGGGGVGMDRRGLQDAISGLNALRGRLDPNDRAFRGYVDNTLGSLRTLNADPRLLDSAISQDAVTSLERLEVELGRRLGEQGAGGARTGAPEASPEQYRDAVAEYFKKLSQGR
jgi:hypothetical protein